MALILHSDFPGLPHTQNQHRQHALPLYVGQLLQTLKGHQSAVTCLKFSKQTNLLLSGSVDKTAIVWAADTGMQMQRVTAHSGTFFCMFCLACHALLLMPSLSCSAFHVLLVMPSLSCHAHAVLCLRPDLFVMPATLPPMLSALLYANDCKLVQEGQLILSALHAEAPTFSNHLLPM